MSETDTTIEQQPDEAEFLPFGSLIVHAPAGSGGAHTVESTARILGDLYQALVRHGLSRKANDLVDKFADAMFANLIVVVDETITTAAGGDRP